MLLLLEHYDAVVRLRFLILSLHPLLTPARLISISHLSTSRTSSVAVRVFGTPISTVYLFETVLTGPVADSTCYSTYSSTSRSIYHFNKKRKVSYLISKGVNL